MCLTGMQNIRNICIEEALYQANNRYNYNGLEVRVYMQNISICIRIQLSSHRFKIEEPIC